MLLDNCKIKIRDKCKIGQPLHKIRLSNSCKIFPNHGEKNENDGELRTE
jgi:hypothetical protein